MIFISKGPSVEPIIDHTRTSISTATVRQVDYNNFPPDSQRNIQVAYYDGEECLGKFFTKRRHKLTKLKKSTNTIRVHVTDDFGNIAKTTFDVSRTIPAISYERVSRTPISIVIEGVKVKNFPNKEDITITYTSDGRKPISHIWKQERQPRGQDYTLVVVHELSGYCQNWGGGIIVATVSDGKKEYTAQCYIHVEGPGNTNTIPGGIK